MQIVFAIIKHNIKGQCIIIYVINYIILDILYNIVRCLLLSHLLHYIIIYAFCGV